MTPDMETDGVARLLGALPDVVARARSVDEVAAWLEAQPTVRGSRVEPALLKSFPPQRVITVDVTDATGQVRAVSVRLLAHVSGGLEFLGIS